MATINFAPSSVRLLNEGGSYLRAATIHVMHVRNDWHGSTHAFHVYTYVSRATPTRRIYRACTAIWQWLLFYCPRTVCGFCSMYGYYANKINYACTCVYVAETKKSEIVSYYMWLATVRQVEYNYNANAQFVVGCYTCICITCTILGMCVVWSACNIFSWVYHDFPLNNFRFLWCSQWHHIHGG